MSPISVNCFPKEYSVSFDAKCASYTSVGFVVAIIVPRYYDLLIISKCGLNPYIPANLNESINIIIWCGCSAE